MSIHTSTINTNNNEEDTSSVRMNQQDNPEEEIERCMIMRRDWGATKETLTPPDDVMVSGRWTGHDPKTETSETGIRIATNNSQRKPLANEPDWETMAELMKKMGIDMIGSTEAGNSDEVRATSQKNGVMSQTTLTNVENRSRKSIPSNTVTRTTSERVG